MPPLKLPQGVKVGNAGPFVAYALQVNSFVEHAKLHFIPEGNNIVSFYPDKRCRGRSSMRKHSLLKKSPSGGPR